VQQFVGADLDVATISGLGQRRQAHGHAGQDRLQKLQCLRRQAENLMVLLLGTRPVIVGQQHRFAGAERDRVVHPGAAAAQTLAQSHHGAGLERAIAGLGIQVADDRGPRCAHRRQLEVLRNFLGAQRLQS